MNILKLKVFTALLLSAPLLSHANQIDYLATLSNRIDVTGLLQAPSQGIDTLNWYNFEVSSPGRDVGLSYSFTADQSETTGILALFNFYNGIASPDKELDQPFASTVVNGTQYNGSFAQLSPGWYSLSVGARWLRDIETSPQSVPYKLQVFGITSPVPEPSSITLMLLGAGAILLRLRSKTAS